MANPRQRSKARAPSHKKIRTSKHAKRNLRKMRPIQGPKALQDAWDNKKTLTQNYVALGLASSVRKQTSSGGSEVPSGMLEPSTSTLEASNVNKPRQRQKFGKIIRDAEGSIIDVQISDDEDSAFEDNTNELDSNVIGTQRPETSKLTKTLEGLASSAKPVKRFSSQREVTELKRLITRHGNNFEAMAKDRQLNPWQRTTGQLQRACKKAGLAI